MPAAAAGVTAWAVAAGLAIREGTAAPAARADAAATAARMIRDDLVNSGPPFRLGLSLGGNDTGTSAGVSGESRRGGQMCSSRTYFSPNAPVTCSKRSSSGWCGRTAGCLLFFFFVVTRCPALVGAGVRLVGVGVRVRVFGAGGGCRSAVARSVGVEAFQAAQQAA